MFYSGVQRPCLCMLNLHFTSTCLKGLSRHIRVTCDTTFQGGTLASLNHATWNPSQWKSGLILDSLCVCACAVALLCPMLPYALWRSDVNNIVFVTSNLDGLHFVTDLALFLSAHARIFFLCVFVSFLEMKKAVPSPSYKQTSMWINKHVWLVAGQSEQCSISFSVCFCLALAWGFCP